MNAMIIALDVGKRLHASGNKKASPAAGTPLCGTITFYLLFPSQSCQTIRFAFFVQAKGFFKKTIQHQRLCCIHL